VSALLTSLLICALMILGALAGALLRHLLPERHLDNHAKDIVRLGCALIATISGLVLGLLINSAKSNFDSQRDEIRQLASKVALLDHLLELYGPQARQARVELRKALPLVVDRIHSEATPVSPFAPTDVAITAHGAIRSLAPADEAQRLLRDRAMQTIDTILQERLILYEQSGTHMPVPFLVVLVFWLCLLFASFSLFSPLNPIAFAAIVLIALSASGAIFLILEMYRPFEGIMRIDAEPLRNALLPFAT
jgi:hypothetical protein